MICKWWHLIWKNIHVELEFLRLEFHRFIFSFFFFVLRYYRSEDQIVQSPTQHSIVQSTRSAHSAFNHPIDQIGSPSIQSTRSSLHSSSILRSSRLCLFKSVLPLVFFKLFFLCSSLDLIFFKYKNRVLETWFCFLELEF